ncbi:cellulase family glycosylhydrolase, partial [bacterium]|nr:cellulase family glycosylhydrolase [bacterium]
MSRRFPALAVLALASLAAAACGTTQSNPASSVADGPAAPLSGSGRWLVDAEGRVVLLHGMNEVAKQAPYDPDAFGFGEDDVAFLGREGFTALRLGVDMRGMMPEPGRIDAGYMERLATTVESCKRHGLFVLLDFHQDGFAPKYQGNGFPDWMGIDDGLPNPPATFPLYYVLNPAMQRAFEHFWADDPIPGGDGSGGAT